MLVVDTVADLYCIIQYNINYCMIVFSCLRQLPSLVVHHCSHFIGLLLLISASTYSLRIRVYCFSLSLRLKYYECICKLSKLAYFI